MQVTTLHELFEVSTSRFATRPCLGARSYDPVTKKYGKFEWMDYQTVQKRRADFGAGLVEIHESHGIASPGQYGVGLWCPNRPEWQLTGRNNPLKRDGEKKKKEEEEEES